MHRLSEAESFFVVFVNGYHRMFSVSQSVNFTVHFQKLKEALKAACVGGDLWKSVWIVFLLVCLDCK